MMIIYAFSISVYFLAFLVGTLLGSVFERKRIRRAFAKIDLEEIANLKKLQELSRPWR